MKKKVNCQELLQTSTVPTLRYAYLSCQIEKKGTRTGSERKWTRESTFNLKLSQLS